MATIVDVVKQVRPDLPENVSEQIGKMVESLTENQVDPNLVAFNISVLSRIYDENPNIEFRVGKTAKMYSRRISFAIDFDFNEMKMVTDPLPMIENLLINDCVGTVNLDIDGLPKDKKIILWSEAPVNAIWKTEPKFNENKELIEYEKVHVALNYGLSYE